MKQSSLRYMIIAILAVIALIFGLSFWRDSQTTSSKTQGSKSTWTSKTVKHDFGTTKLSKEPKRIVILNNLYAEVLMPLGITPIGATTAQAGSNQFSTLFKKDFKDAQVVSVGWQKEPDLEKIAELNPDLILMTVHQEELYDKLSAIAPTIGYRMDTESNWDYTDVAKKVAGIFNRESDMQDILDETNADIANFKKKVTSTFGNQKLMYVRVTEKDIRYYGYGRFGYLYENYGFNRAQDFPAESMYEIIDTEKLKELDPDLLIVQADSEELLQSKLQESSVWSNLTAVKNDKVIYADYSTYMLGFGVVSQKAVMKQISDEWLSD